MASSADIEDPVAFLVYQEYDNTDSKYATVKLNELVGSVLYHVNHILFELDNDREYVELTYAIDLALQKYNNLIRKYVKYHVKHSALDNNLTRGET